MSLYDCPKCWEILCVCGHEYRNMSVPKRMEIAAAALGLQPGRLSEIVLSAVPVEHPMKEKRDGA